jgi:hypothetical protein
MSIKSQYTENEAQALHDYRQAHDPEHDRGGCWCCCMDCDFDFDAIMGVEHEQEEAAGTEKEPQRSAGSTGIEEPVEPEVCAAPESGPPEGAVN